MNDTFAFQDLARFAEVIANVRLLFDPIDIAQDAFPEVDGWFVTCRSSQLSVAGEVAHFAGPKFAVDLGRDVDFQNVRKLLRYLVNRCAASVTDVYGQSIELVGFGRETVRARNLFDEGKIARLLAIFIKHRRKII